MQDSTGSKDEKKYPTDLKDREWVLMKGTSRCYIKKEEGRQNTVNARYYSLSTGLSSGEHGGRYTIVIFCGIFKPFDLRKLAQSTTRKASWIPVSSYLLDTIFIDNWPKTFVQ